MTQVFQKFTGYILLKWCLFYSYQFLEGQTTWSWKSANAEGIFLTVFMLLAIPFIELLILLYPVILALRQNGWLRMMILSQVFTLEFLIAWIATNQQLASWMVIKIILSVGVFALLFRKQLYLTNSRNPYQ